ncbi:helix-turn-helix transcriptional regulator [Stutzerimonas stutzeri]|uniref:helix-turn-helix domain-containing protein n=1 Tax=Stutzerimonas sp. S1 TaxID=3030652 RepID=UPI0022253EE0|nr:helix-turn-helix transcriptional regulator [Stutzerimonas sp. S1]MCW3150188.1 helix-turn-helix transcriptional regulator [Stutzerimonas sp. S1]
MNVQVIMRDGAPEYAVLPWSEYEALLSEVGRQAAALQQPQTASVLNATPALRQLAELREAKGMSIEALARSVGISPAYLAMIESAERTPDTAIRRALARALDIPRWEEDA